MTTSFRHYLTTVRFGSTISHIRGNSSISIINSPSRSGSPDTLTLPAATASGNVVSLAMTSSSTLRAKVTKPVRVMFVMSMLNGRALAAGRKTAADEIIQLAGGVNAIDGYDGYKPVNDEAIVAAKPDVVLSIDRGKDSLTSEAVFAHPAFALTPVAANKAFISMEGLYLLGFGPRTATAARDLSVKLYPALEIGRAHV